jgi:hypothetical protein
MQVNPSGRDEEAAEEDWSWILRHPVRSHENILMRTS